VPLAEGSEVLYPNIRNVPQRPQLTLFAANAGSQAVTVEVRLGSSQGELLGTCTVHPTGTTHWRGYRNHWCRLDTQRATLDLCLVFPSSANTSIRFDHFSLTAP
ncbi:MAG: carbohydrate-binding protein, partial [Alkalispirochaeta sp.]